MTMNRHIELPLIEPMYSTYHYQGAATATLVNNPSLRNFYLNQVMALSCTRKFLHGFTTPEVTVRDSSWQENPYFDKVWYTMYYLDGYIHYAIRKLLDAGFYVCYSGADDYYVEGKSWFHERHFYHDGCICGYDRDEGSYCMYAYDRNWIYRKFRTTRASFERGRKALFRKGQCGFICGIRPKGTQIAFSPETALANIAEYLSSDKKTYYDTEEGPVYGIIVHDYIARYIDLLYDGSVPHEKMDRRVFRMVWEHKKVMLERIGRIESALGSDGSVSAAYGAVVREADHCRMLYAAHHMKERRSVLPTIRKKLLALKETERALLEQLTEISKGKEKT